MAVSVDFYNSTVANYKQGEPRDFVLLVPAAQI